MSRHTPLHLATPQQRRVLRALRDHASLKEAAAELHIEYSTARSHLDRLRQRTGARNNADLFYWLGVEEIGL